MPIIGSEGKQKNFLPLLIFSKKCDLYMRDLSDCSNINREDQIMTRYDETSMMTSGRKPWSALGFPKCLLWGNNAMAEVVPGSLAQIPKKSETMSQTLENKGFVVFSALPENLRDMSGRSGKGQSPSLNPGDAQHSMASARERKQRYAEQ